jgi:hypothetical protein
VTGAGWDETYDEEMIRQELERIRTSTKVIEDEALSEDEALELWRNERERRSRSVEVTA